MCFHMKNGLEAEDAKRMQIRLPPGPYSRSVAPNAIRSCRADRRGSACSGPSGRSAKISATPTDESPMNGTTRRKKYGAARCSGSHPPPARAGRHHRHSPSAIRTQPAARTPGRPETRNASGKKSSAVQTTKTCVPEPSDVLPDKSPRCSEVPDCISLIRLRGNVLTRPVHQTFLPFFSAPFRPGQSKARSGNRGSYDESGLLHTVAAQKTDCLNKR